MVSMDKYVDYINNLEEEVINDWSKGLEELMNNEISCEAKEYDYEELENAYKEYIS